LPPNHRAKKELDIEVLLGRPPGFAASLNRAKAFCHALTSTAAAAARFAATRIVELSA
jgi:hypothetical protein